MVASGSCTDDDQAFASDQGGRQVGEQEKQVLPPAREGGAACACVANRTFVSTPVKAILAGVGQRAESMTIQRYLVSPKSCLL